LKAASVSGDPNGVRLSWKASNSDIDGYLIERKSGTGDWEMTSSASTDKTNVTETGLKTNTIYSYRVKAYKLYVNSEPSNIIEFNNTAEKPVISDQIDLDFFVDDTIYKINGISSVLDVSPVIKEGRTLIPIRYVTAPLGADIQWIDEEKKIIINQGATIIELWIGKNKAEINGKSVPIDPDNDTVMPLIINGRTMMPLRFIAENLGCEVKWIPEKQIKIIYQSNKLDPQPEPPIN
jgi:titin